MQYVKADCCQGRETERETRGEGSTVRRFVTGPVRDFMMVIDKTFDVVEMDVDDVAAVISATNGRDIGGRQLRVNEAEDKGGFVAVAGDIGALPEGGEGDVGGIDGM